MGELRSCKRDGERGAHGGSRNGSPVGGHPRGNVGGYDRHARRGQGPHHPRGLSREPARQTGSEQRVDGAIGVLELAREPAESAAPRERHDGDPEVLGAGEIHRRVSTELSGIAEREHAHVDPGFPQQPRRRQTVAAVVARPADDDGPPPSRKCGERLLGEGRCRVFHQRERGSARPDRRGIRPAHLAGSENGDQARSVRVISAISFTTRAVSVGKSGADPEAPRDAARRARSRRSRSRSSGRSTS